MKKLFNYININKKNGLSLIELSVVLIIIGFIAVSITSSRAIIRHGHEVKGRNLSREFQMKFGSTLPIPNVWYDSNDSSTITTSSDNKVSMWQDKSGNELNATQETTSNQPSHITDTTGNSTISFDGTANNYLNFPTDVFQGVKAFTIFIVSKKDNVSDNDMRFFDVGADTVANMFFTPKSSNNDTRFAITTGGSSSEKRVTFSLLEASAYYLFSISLDRTSLTVWQNGISKGTATTGITPSSFGTIYYSYLGKSIYSDPYLSGCISEFIVFNEVLTSTQREIVESYLNEKWDIY